MTPGLFLLVVLAGGVGACVRYVVDALIRSRVTSSFPWPTAVINLTGSFVLGLLAGLVADDIASPAVSAAVGTGFLGGYTTFSTASYETVQLIRKKKYGVALAYGVGILVAAIALAFAGYRWGLSL
ncbi:fluoride efflux transporter CrcB [Cellulomonas chengniuliangii]|uniref:Fluoride-specific ion channel FluC n=1 Tax=Cellulomonas chengniuliangii TaxID=2968084 RepID=A0ABY5KZR7_9CELL|nr:fluoride efflux transporter CrcB [Cellulomonas chengniuliangii]MCC2307571.1 fluoride efflux transporter CrcB [Cellulomonas chengniuliangii]MCC2318683.1 fluoride efflux transporter CrcB [Cellulomonas chengniuliangii]UUI75659.1 fluoride efflux transporter CrcB [Cellulomonas chengniuliangii]